MLWGSFHILFKEGSNTQKLAELEFVQREIIVYNVTIFPGLRFSKRCCKYASQMGYNAVFIGKCKYQFSEEIFANIFRVDWEDFDIPFNNVALF